MGDFCTGSEGSTSTGAVHALVDHLFRRSAGRMVAALTRVFGAADLDLAEEVVQEALARALQRWPFHGVPDDPEAWLLAVARNRALDRLRRRGTAQSKEEALGRAIEAAAAGAGEPPPEPYLAGEPSDDQLRLLFLCCHPALSRDARVALTLKAACGFGVDEIAAAFLDKPATVAQRLVRAKRTLRERRPSFELPPPARLATRLDSVLEVLYLLFNEGYAAHGGGPLVRAELCQEALRLAARLARLPATARPEVHALLALMLFQSSRLPARVDGAGRLVLLADQDRELWDRRAVAAAFRHLERAATGDRETPYHLQAAIASHHVAAASPETTDWPAILVLYDRLLELQATPVVALNRTVAVARVEGPAAALAATDALDPEALAAYAPYHATRARLLADLGRPAEALAACRRAAELACSEPERRFLEEMAVELRAEARASVGGPNP